MGIEPMTLSPTGRAWLKGHEGLSLVAYRDGNGYSIGYGHHGAYEGQRITRAEAEALFDRDVALHERAVSQALTRPTTQAQFDALVSFSYNVGSAGMASSTVVREHNQGRPDLAAAAFDLWIKSKGEVAPVLVRRRNLEEQLYRTGVYGRTASSTPALPAPAAPNPALLVALAAAGATYLLLPKLAPRRFSRAA